MAEQVLEREQILPTGIDDAFAFFADRLLVRRDLERIFDYRRDTIADLLSNTS